MKPLDLPKTTVDDEVLFALLKERVELVKSRAGCGDNSCLFRKPQGAGTNGGCTCLGVGGKPFLRAALAQLYRTAEDLCEAHRPHRDGDQDGH